MTMGDVDDVEIIADIDHNLLIPSPAKSFDKNLDFPVSKENLIAKYKLLYSELSSYEIDVIKAEETGNITYSEKIAKFDQRSLEDAIVNSDEVSSLRSRMLLQLQECERRVHNIEESQKGFTSTSEKFESDVKVASLNRFHPRVPNRMNNENTDDHAYTYSRFLNGTHPNYQGRSNHASPHLNFARARTRQSRLPSAVIDPSGEVIHVGQVALQRPHLPAHGQVVRSELVCGMRVLAVKSSFFGVWLKSTIISVKNTDSGKGYRIRTEPKKENISKIYTAKELAYDKPPTVILPVGSRVVAHYRPEDTSARSALYSGIIAEPPKNMNRYRYLVFFDDGYAQYVKHTEVHLVCEASKNVWEDVHPDSKEFIKHYMQQYPERPMVKVQKDQVIKTEWNNEWWTTRVLAVDASMVKMFFDADQRTEWIYRGSTRLEPLFSELANAAANRLSGKNRRHNINTKRPHQPYVEYTRGIDEPIIQHNDHTVQVKSKSEALKEKQDVPRRSTDGQIRNVAKKSTTQEKRSYAPYVTFAERQLTQLGELKSQMGYKEIEKVSLTRTIYQPHVTCSEECIFGNDDPTMYKGKNPLLIPVYLRWERQITKHRGMGKQLVLYRGPCGRRLRNIEEVNCFLLKTRSKLTIDLFSFDCYVHIFETFKPKEPFVSIEDITLGKENIPVSCVNNLENERPPKVEYSAERFPGKGVHLNLDSDFLCGCDCEDNCQDREKCQCQQLTENATDALITGRIPEAGYKYRRLNEPLVTGVYECNSQCKCGPSCVNRVVQNGLKVRLQMFKTERRGWGIRCLDDLPQGMFICIYSGQLLTEQGADEDGHQFGDEYLAELDHIEVVEKLKEGYESDAVEEQSEDDDDDDDDESEKKVSNDDSDDESIRTGSSGGLMGNDSDSDFDPSVETTVSSNTYATRSKDRGNKSKISSLPDVQGSSLKSKNWLNSMSCISLSDESSNHTTPSPIVGLLDDHSCSPSQVDGMSTKSDATESDDSEKRHKKLSLSTKHIRDHSLDGTDSVNLKHAQKKNPPAVNHVMPFTNKNCVEEQKSFLSIRAYYSEEYCYIMDAKSKGNIGRYLNHSCSPNVFVQNVFVDTQDLRFPWVAFFAATFIQAGTELTWDYNYDVGSVPGKCLYCYCGSEECRGRLL